MTPQATPGLSFLNSVQQARIDAGESLLGYIVSWDSGDAHIARDAARAPAGEPDLTSIFSQNNVDPKWMPSDFEAKTAYLRARRSVESGLPKPPKHPNTQKFIQIKNESDEIVIGLVDNRVDQAQSKVDPKPVCVITFDVKTKTITSDVHHEVVDKLRESMTYFDGFHVGDDIRSFFTSWLAAHGVLIRQTGGIYFVPSTHVDELQRVVSVVQTASKFRVYSLAQTNFGGNQKVLAQQTQNGLEEEIRQLEAHLADIKTEKVRESTLIRKISEFDELRARAEMFASLLSFKADAIKDRVTEAQKKLQEQIAGVQDRDAKKEAEKAAAKGAPAVVGSTEAPPEPIPAAPTTTAAEPAESPPAQPSLFDAQAVTAAPAADPAPTPETTSVVYDDEIGF